MNEYAESDLPGRVLLDEASATQHDTGTPNGSRSHDVSRRKVNYLKDRIIASGLLGTCEQCAGRFLACIVLTAVLADFGRHLFNEKGAAVSSKGNCHEAGLGLTVPAQATLHRGFVVLKSVSHN